MLAYICKEKQGQVLVLAEQQDLFDSLIVTGNALGSASSPKKPESVQGGIGSGCARGDSG